MFTTVEVDDSPQEAPMTLIVDTESEFATEGTHEVTISYGFD